MRDLSQDAISVCARWFAGPKNTLRSSPPHATLSQHREAIEELIAAGLIGKSDFNQHGVIELTGSTAAAQIGWERQREILKTMGFAE